MEELFVRRQKREGRRGGRREKGVMKGKGRERGRGGPQQKRGERRERERGGGRGREGIGGKAEDHGLHPSIGTLPTNSMRKQMEWSGVWGLLGGE